MLRALLLALLGHAAALQPAVASTHARRVHRTPTVHALAGGRGAALAAGLSLAASQAASAAEAVAPWAYSTLLDEIDAKHVTSALLSNDGKQVMTIDVNGVRHESQVSRTRLLALAPRTVEPPPPPPAPTPYPYLTPTLSRGEPQLTLILPFPRRSTRSSSSTA